MRVDAVRTGLLAVLSTCLYTRTPHPRRWDDATANTSRGTHLTSDRYQPQVDPQTSFSRHISINPKATFARWNKHRKQASNVNEVRFRSNPT
jgi:hypothetical protein